MGTLQGYILRQLASVTAIVTLTLLLLVWLSQSLRFIDLIVNRGLPLGDFLYLLVFLVPWFLGIVLPIAVFVAVLFVHNRLTNESELAVCQACGLSPWQIAGPGIVLAFAVTALTYAISLYLYPASYHAFKNLQYEIRNDHSAVVLQEGRFNQISETVTVYVAARTPDGALRNILVHNASDPENPVTMMASRGVLVRTETGPRVVLKDGNRQVRDAESGKLSMLYFDRYTLDLGQAQQPASSRWRQPQERYLGQLLYPADTPRDQYNRTELIAEGHHRIVFPLYALAFAGVGLAATVAPAGHRLSGRHHGVAVGVVAAMQMGHMVLTDMAIRDLDLIAGMYALVALACALPYLLLSARVWRGLKRLRRVRRAARAGAAASPA